MSKKHKKHHKQNTPKVVQNPVLKLNGEIDALYLKLANDDERPVLTDAQISKIKKDIATKQNELQKLLKSETNEQK